MTGNLSKQGVEFPETCHECLSLGLREQRIDLDCLLRGGLPVKLPVEQVLLVRRKHVHSLPSSSTWRSRWRAVNSLDFTVLTGIPIASEISS